MKTVAKDFGAEVVRGNKGCSDHEPNLRARNMIFTRPINLGVINFDAEVMDYLAYSEETGSSGYKHYQGFVCWKSDRWTYACKKKYGHYFSKMKGSLIQNDDYCSKQGTLTEFGRLPRQGERTDLSRIVNDIFEHKTNVDEIVEHTPMLYHQYGRTLEKAEDIALRKCYRTEMTKGIWYVGKTGRGKSERAFNDFDINTAFVYPYDNGWWDGYKQQHTVIFDEFRGQIPFNELLRIVDKHPNYKCRRRNREPIPFNSKRVIITSSLKPEEVYHNLDHNDNIDQLKRRFEVYQL